MKSSTRQAEMKKMYSEGMSFTAIARHYDLSRCRIRQIVRDLPSNKKVIVTCDICSEQRTIASEAAAGRICRSCYLIRSADRKDVKETRSLLASIKRDYNLRWIL